MSTQPIPRLTVDQYLEIERKAEFKRVWLLWNDAPGGGI